MKSTVFAVLALVPVLGLAGCGGDDSSGSSDKTPSTTPTSQSASATPTVEVTSPPNLPGIPQFKGNPAGIIADVKDIKCSTDPGTVTASGTVTNTAPGPRDIAISMSWVTQGGSDVLARGVVKLPQVAVGKVTAWKVTATLKATQPVQCVPTAQRGTFAGKG